MSTNQIPDNIRLIASVSRLIDLHQSRRGSGVYVPVIPDNAGYLLSIALMVMECLHAIELERGLGMTPIGNVYANVRERLQLATNEEIQYCIDTLSTGREIQYSIQNETGDFDVARTWDSTPLLNVAEGFQQVQLSENGRLLLRVSSLKDSWLYSDLDAEKLVKAIERGQFKDIPKFCREMTLDLATKNKKISVLLEHPSVSDLREMLIAEGQNISQSLLSAIETIKKAITLIYDERTKLAFNSLSEKDKPPFELSNLRSDLHYVQSNVESVSRNFLKFLSKGQDVRTQGAERIKFLEISDYLVLEPPTSLDEIQDAILSNMLPFKSEIGFFEPSMLIGEVSFRLESPLVDISTEFTIDPIEKSKKSTFTSFLEKNRAILLTRLKEGPMLFSEVLQLSDLALDENESAVDFFGVYATPSLLDADNDNDNENIAVGINNETTVIVHGESVLICSDPIMFIEDKNDTK